MVVQSRAGLKAQPAEFTDISFSLRGAAAWPWGMPFG